VKTEPVIVALPEPLTAEWINRLPADKRKEVLAGDFGKRMFAWARSYITHFQWIRQTTFGIIVRNGSCFFLDLNGHLYLITAAHVYTGFLEAKEKFGDRIVCYVGHIPFDPKAHLRDHDKHKDIAIFNYPYEELAKIEGKQAIAPARWPPPEPICDLPVFLGGFPGEGRRWFRQNALRFGLHLCATPITVVTDRQITCRFDRKTWVKRVGVPLPAFGADLGGISGGPVLLPLDNGQGVWDFYLAGIITQAHSSVDYETVISIRSHFINLNGTISRI
jgi:hypothetical protein